MTHWWGIILGKMTKMMLVLITSGRMLICCVVSGETVHGEGDEEEEDVGVVECVSGSGVGGLTSHCDRDTRTGGWWSVGWWWPTGGCYSPAYHPTRCSLPTHHASLQGTHLGTFDNHTFQCI